MGIRARSIGLLGLSLLIGVGSGGGTGPALAQEAVGRGSHMIKTENLGVMGTGTKFFRCGLEHSTGVVYLGTYGPQPAIVWKYDPGTGKLAKVGEPGEYQLDSMVEAPDGKVYIGTAYGAIVYQLDPKTEAIKSLGTPPIDSTTWIFTMVRTRQGEIYGAKGVGLFRLDWRKEKLEAIGPVPGNHRTLGANSSSPIVRMLVEDQDGNIWGDTNRWLFRFSPKTGKIDPLLDMPTVDPASYALFLAYGGRPTPDQYFAAYSRFSGLEVKNPFYVYRAATGKLEPLRIEGLQIKNYGTPFWWKDGDRDRLLVSGTDGNKPAVWVLDPFAGKVVDRWTTDADNELSLSFLPGPGLYAMSGHRGRLLKADPAAKKLVTVATNPTPVECRCLAASTQRVLGADSYDCGYAFTLDLKTQERKDHGKVWEDDHRSNYGPAAFAGEDGRHLVCNHSEGMPSLWVTDTKTNEHWRIGDCAVQLVAVKDGSVWGTTGRNPPDVKFSANSCWTPGWQAEPGVLFRYQPKGKTVERFEGLGRVGIVVEAPGGGRLLAAQDNRLLILDAGGARQLGKLDLKAKVLAGAADREATVAYLVLADGSLQVCQAAQGGSFELREVARAFGPVDRGFFVLPKGKCAVGVAGNGPVTVYDPSSGKVQTLAAPPPPPAGPAVDPVEDAWYYAGETVTKYVLARQ